MSKVVIATTGSLGGFYVYNFRKTIFFYSVLSTIFINILLACDKLTDLFAGFTTFIPTFIHSQYLSIPSVFIGLYTVSTTTITKIVNYLINNYSSLFSLEIIYITNQKARSL